MENNQLYIIRIRRSKRPDLFFDRDSRLAIAIKSTEATRLPLDQAQEALKRLKTESFFLCSNGAARIIPVEEADLPDPPTIKFHIAYIRRKTDQQMKELKNQIELQFKKKYPDALYASSYSALAVPDYVMVTGFPYKQCKEMEAILFDIMRETINERMELQHA